MSKVLPLGTPISRRAVLKGIGAGLGSALLLPAPSLLAKANGGGKSQAFVYLDHAGRVRWGIAGVLVGNPRRLRQILRRTKSARLPRAFRATPQIKAAFAPPELAQHLYGLLAKEGGLRQRRTRGVEIYAIHFNRFQFPNLSREQTGQVHLQMVKTLLESMHLSRFHEVFVYYNLPSVRAISRRAYRDGIQVMAGRHGHGVLAAYVRRPLLNHGHQGFSTPHLPGETHFPDDAIQLTEFVAQAFLQDFEGTNTSGVATLGPVVKANLDAATVPEILAVMA